jgi:predicted RNA-binding Zn-ribbon protein involved in translation (DUF1610 family)
LQMHVCTSCGRSSYDYVEFACPGAGDSGTKLVRCAKCRDTENSYVCPTCGFHGP